MINAFQVWNNDPVIIHRISATIYIIPLRSSFTVLRARRTWVKTALKQNLPIARDSYAEIILEMK
jgi:hypothetical protein